MAITNKEINLAQLDQELGGHGLIADFNDSKKKLILPAENSPVTDEEIQTAIVSHVATDTNALRAKARQAILDRLGLTAEEAAILLG